MQHTMGFGRRSGRRLPGWARLAPVLAGMIFVVAGCDPPARTPSGGRDGRPLATQKAALTGKETSPALCDGSWTDLGIDTDNCGRCGRRCADGASCSTERQCHCPRFQFVCDGQCVDVRSDPAHCGRCDRSCGEGARCDQGRCLP